MIVAPDEDTNNADDIVEYYESHDRDLCEGKYAFQELPEVRGPVLKRLMTACSADDGWERHYTLFRRAKGGVYIEMAMSHMASDGGWPVRAFDAQIVQAIEALK
jgi:hypothetical protein